jgi:hypothetical protein
MLSSSILQDDIATSATNTMGDIKEQSKNFGRGPNPKKLTKWQEAVNDEAAKHVRNDPMLVQNRGYQQNFEICSYIY